MSEPLVIVGNGMAAARLVDELAKVALGRYAIAVIGDEPRLAYNRVLLSSVLAGETASQDIELRPASWWRDRGVTLKYGCVATEIDVGRRELKIANEESVPFSKLVLTTKSAGPDGQERVQTQTWSLDGGNLVVERAGREGAVQKTVYKKTT